MKRVEFVSDVAIELCRHPALKQAFSGEIVGCGAGGFTDKYGRDFLGRMPMAAMSELVHLCSHSVVARSLLRYSVQRS